MNTEKMIGQFISTILISTILGVIAGLIWKFALNADLKTFLVNGGIIGGIIGFLFAFSNNQSIKSRKFQYEEASFASGGILFGLFFITIITAIITGLIKWIF